MPDLVMPGPDGRPQQPGPGQPGPGRPGVAPSESPRPGVVRPGAVRPGTVRPAAVQPGTVQPWHWRPRPRPLLRTLVGGVLRRTRLAQGRTLSDVARAARVSVPYLSELERGRKEASAEVLAAICDALRIGLPGLLAELGRELAHGRELAPAREATPAREAADAPAQVIRLGTAGGSRISPAVRRSGDAQCLLAA